MQALHICVISLVSCTEQAIELLNSSEIARDDFIALDVFPSEGEM